MTRFRVPPGAKQIEMQDGSMLRGSGSYKRGRVIETDNPAHVRAIKAQAKANGHIQAIDFTAPRGTRERICPCGFTAYSWQPLCPRCGKPTEEV